MRGKPSLLIFGGFDTAAMPEIGYGSQRGGLTAPSGALDRRPRDAAGHELRVRRWREIADNVEGIDPARVEVVYHGIPDRFAERRSGAPAIAWR